MNFCESIESTILVYYSGHGWLDKSTNEYYLIPSDVIRDVTQSEDKSRIRTKPLPQIMAIAKNLALNLYRNAGFKNMAQAERKCKFGLAHRRCAYGDHILEIFRMK